MTEAGPDISRFPYATPSAEYDPPPPTPEQSAVLQQELGKLHPIQEQADVVAFVGEADAQAKLLESLALATANGEFDKIKKDKVGQIGHLTFKYAPLQNILDVVRSPLAKQGLSLLQFVTGSPLGTDYTRVTSMVCGHGARVQAVFDFNPRHFGEEKGSGSPAQRLGKTWTYLRRMQLQALLCLAGDTDDDEALEQAPKRSAKQSTPPTPPPGKATTPEKPAVGRVVRSRTTTVKRGARRPPPPPPAASTMPDPVDEETPEGARPEDWPQDAFIPPDAPVPTPDPAPVEVQETEVVEERTVLDVTQGQKDSLRALCQTAGLTKNVKINAFVRGQCGAGVNAGNINGAQADMVIGALRKLIAEQAAGGQ